MILIKVLSLCLHSPFYWLKLASRRSRLVNFKKAPLELTLILKLTTTFLLKANQILHDIIVNQSKDYISLNLESRIILEIWCPIKTRIRRLLGRLTPFSRPLTIRCKRSSGCDEYIASGKMISHDYQVKEIVHTKYSI